MRESSILMRIIISIVYWELNYDSPCAYIIFLNPNNGATVTSNFAWKSRGSEKLSDQPKTT